MNTTTGAAIPSTSSRIQRNPPYCTAVVVLQYRPADGHGDMHDSHVTGRWNGVQHRIPVCNDGVQSGSVAANNWPGILSGGDHAPIRIMCMCVFPANTNHLHNIYTMLDQRQRRWADVV